MHSAFNFISHAIAVGGDEFVHDGHRLEVDEYGRVLLDGVDISGYLAAIGAAVSGSMSCFLTASNHSDAIILPVDTVVVTKPRKKSDGTGWHIGKSVVEIPAQWEIEQAIMNTPPDASVFRDNNPSMYSLNKVRALVVPEISANLAIAGVRAPGPDFWKAILGVQRTRNYYRSVAKLYDDNRDLIDGILDHVRGLSALMSIASVSSAADLLGYLGMLFPMEKISSSVIDSTIPRMSRVRTTFVIDRAFLELTDSGEAEKVIKVLLVASILIFSMVRGFRFKPGRSPYLSRMGLIPLPGRGIDVHRDNAKTLLELYEDGAAIAYRAPTVASSGDIVLREYEQGGETMAAKLLKAISPVESIAGDATVAMSGYIVYAGDLEGITDRESSANTQKLLRRIDTPWIYVNLVMNPFALLALRDGSGLMEFVDWYMTKVVSENRSNAVYQGARDVGASMA